MPASKIFLTCGPNYFTLLNADNHIPLPVSWQSQWKPSTIPVQLHAFRISDFSGVVQQYRHILTAAEIEKSERFYHRQDAQSYLLARVVCKILFSQYNHIPLSELELISGTYKKPSIQVQSHIQPIFPFFNWAHSGDFLLIGFSQIEVGVDLETYRHFDFTSMLDEILNPEEIRFVHTHSNPMWAFLYLWTRKEAVLKGLGSGLTDQLYRFPVLAPFFQGMSKPCFQLQSWSEPEAYLAAVSYAAAQPLPIEFYSLSPETFSGF